MTALSRYPSELAPVAYVRGGRTVPQDDGWGESRAVVELDRTRFTAAAFLGLQSFSHAETVFLFDQVTEDQVIVDARHPRGREDWPKVGIFAQRGKSRPNRLGVSVCRIVRVDGRRLEVQGLDAIDGTPVLDIKPVITGFLLRGVVREPEWAIEIMARYWQAKH